MNWIKRRVLPLLISLLVLGSCTSELEQWVREEQQKGEQHNALIFGMEIGQEQQYFFDRCTELNKQKRITQGKGRYAEYVLQPKDTTNAADRIEMQFYGIFNENKISGMNMKFSYRGWAPWNEQYQPEVLLEQMKDTLMHWFKGNDFRTLQIDASEAPAYVKVDGNRLMRLFVINNYQVAVRIEDLNQRK
jgi:hypothetical protein